MIDTSGGSLGLRNSSTLYIKRQVGLQNIAAHDSEKRHRRDVSSSDGSGSDRETYGLAILELMSDHEYKAWQKVTAGMSSGEKMLAVQKLYPLADLDRLKSKIDVRVAKSDSNHASVSGGNSMGIRGYAVNGDFVQRYRNAYAHVQSDINMSC